VETLDTPKYRTTPGFHSRSLPAYLRMDVWRGPTKLYRKEPRGKPTWTCRHLLLRLFRAYFSYQLSGIAKGLCYLHSCNVSHENLKGVRDHSNSSFTTLLMPGQSNILVDAAGHARITDYGLAKVTRKLSSAHSSAGGGQINHTVRWTAPEVLNDEKYGKEADIYSFAMVMVEVCHR
jgi:serine/threonine protein kinase